MGVLFLVFLKLNFDLAYVVTRSQAPDIFNMKVVV